MWHVKISWYEKLHQAQLQTQNTPEIPLSAQTTSLVKTPSTTNMYNSAAWGVPPGCPCLQHPAATWGWSWESNNQRWSKLAKQHASTCRKPESYVLLSWDCGTNLESSKDLKWQAGVSKHKDLQTYLLCLFGFILNEILQTHGMPAMDANFIFPPHKTLAEKRAFAVMPRCCRPNSFAKSRPNSSVSSWSAEDGEVPHIRKMPETLGFWARLA